MAAWGVRDGRRSRGIGAAFAAVLIAGLATSAAAQTDGAPAQPPPLRMAANPTGAVIVDGPVRSPTEGAQALAGYLASDDLLLGPQSMAQARQGMLRVFAERPEMRQLETQFPGAHRAIVDASMPIVAESMRRRAPDLRMRLAAFYDGTYTPTEIARLRGFFGSPAGARFIAGMQRNFAPDAILDSMVASPSITPDTGAINADLAEAGAATAMAMAPADQQALMKLAEGGLLEKMSRASGDGTRIVAEWGGQLTQDDQRALMAAGQRVIQDLVARRRPAK